MLAPDLTHGLRQPTPPAMQSYPAPAARLVADMTDAAARRPEDAVAFQGAPGAYSHLALLEVSPLALPLPCFAFEDAFEAVEQGRAEMAVIPIENSLHGRVADVHFLLPESDLFIVGEHFLRVRHCLLGLPGTSRADIKEAISHPQALGQCRQRLRDWGIRPVAYADTAAAAALVAEQGERSAAAIASRLAAEAYGLDVLADGIEDVDHNTTRFVVLARKPVAPTPEAGSMMTSLTFAVKSVPSALYKALGGFATNGVNMTKLESYMRDGSFAAAFFYAEIEGAPGDPHVDRALAELSFHSREMRIIGSFPRAKERLLPTG
jgi:prephenate dehydratase